MFTYKKVFLWITLLIVVGCRDSGGDSGQLATPTPLPTPVIAEKPEYVVEQGNIVNTLEFTGRVSPETEQELFFRGDGFVSDVFVARGDEVAVGDIVAQLDINDLEAQLASAQLQLETAQANLDKAIQENEDGIREAEISLSNSRLALRTAEANLSNAAVDNQDGLIDAQFQLQLSQLNLQSAEINLSNASTDNTDQLEEARLQLWNSQLALQSAEINQTNAWQQNQDSITESGLQLNNAQLSLQQAQAQPQSSSVVQAEIELNNARERVTDAEREWQEVNERDWATEDEINFYADDLANARDQLRIAEANYNEAVAADNNRWRDIERAQNDVALSELSVTQANRGVDPGIALDVQQAQLDVTLRQHTVEQLERGIDPTLALEVQKARLDLQIQQQNVSKLQRGIDPILALDVEKARLDVELQEFTLEKLRRGVDPLLALDVEKAELDVADIERQIAEARLTAPFAGTVLSLDIAAGDSAQAFDAVVTLAEPGLLEISAELTAEELVDMSVGQVAIIQLRNRPEEELTGFVRQLPAGYSGSTVSSDDDSSVRIAFNFDLTTAGDSGELQLPFELEIGELATIIIILQEKNDVLYLPPEAIRSFQGRDFVVVRDADGTQRRVDVRVGITSEDRVEIESGLEAGWVIVGE